jgi:hypothetical protein
MPVVATAGGTSSGREHPCCADREKGSEAVSPVAIVWPCPLAVDAYAVVAGGGCGPQVMATLRNVAIASLKMTRHTSIAAACRHHGWDATRSLGTLGLSPIRAKRT